MDDPWDGWPPHTFTEGSFGDACRICGVNYHLHLAPSCHHKNHTNFDGPRYGYTSDGHLEPCERPTDVPF